MRNCLLKSEKGGVINNLQNSQFALENDPTMKGAIQKNLLSGQIEIVKPMLWRRNGLMLTDTDQSNIELFLEKNYGLTNQRKIATAVSIVANEHQYHPIRDYLMDLEWDQTPRVRYALHHFLGAEVTDFNEECLRVFMLGTAERVFHPGSKFELMLCLVGGQGAGKSSFFRLLAVHDDWFSDDLKKLDDENIYRKLQGHWIIEMSEMIATANAKSIEEIKSFLSRQKETYKVPYDKYPEDRPRQCVFAGTTNRQDFLPRDRTGNRRFLPVAVFPENAEQHPLENEIASRRYIDQMWAEIMAQYRTGKYSLHLSAESEKLLRGQQQDFTQEDTRAGTIFSFFEDYPGDRLCSKQIYKEALDHPYDEPQDWETRNICEIVNTGIANGDIQGWKAFKSPKRFGKYGTQKGWERMETVNREQKENVNRGKSEQLSFTVVKDVPDHPWEEQPSVDFSG